jgi:hypothetical protein
MRQITAILTLLNAIFVPAIGKAECLDRANDWTYLGSAKTYTNGKLRFRIDGWHFATERRIPRGTHLTDREIDELAQAVPDETTIDVRSTAPMFNGRWGGGSADSRHFGSIDRRLCPGIEIRVDCTFKIEHAPDSDPWYCTFSEF